MKELTGLFELLMWVIFFVGWLMGVLTSHYFQRIKKFWSE